MKAVRTTIDLPAPVLARAKRLAAERGVTLSSVVVDALSSHLSGSRQQKPDKPFELVVRGRAGARFPGPEEIESVGDEEDVAALGIPGVRGRAAP